MIATKGKEQYFIECKYYQRTGKNANVQVPMYIRSRVNDLIEYRNSLAEFDGFNFKGCVATNTRFTSDAISFGECTGLRLLSWDYPKGNGLKEFIDQERIFPVTVLTRLLVADKQKLMEQGVVLCNQLLDYPDALLTIGLDEAKQRKVMEEVRYLCS